MQHDANSFCTGIWPGETGDMTNAGFWLDTGGFAKSPFENEKVGDIWMTKKSCDIRDN